MKTYYVIYGKSRKDETFKPLLIEGSYYSHNMTIKTQVTWWFSSKYADNRSALQDLRDARIYYELDNYFSSYEVRTHRGI